MPNRQSDHCIKDEYSACYFVVYQLMHLSNEMCGKILPTPFLKQTLVVLLGADSSFKHFPFYSVPVDMPSLSF